MEDGDLLELTGAVRRILDGIGEDPEREGLRKTPDRVARALSFFTSGYGMDVEAILQEAVFHESYDEMVVVKDIEIYSLCEHHMLPFFGRCHVAYIPNGKIIGLSKIPRIVDAFARRLQVQERLTSQIADAIHRAIEPKGVGVVIDAAHLCMMMRGVQKQNSSAETSALRGLFKSDPRTRAEFLGLIRARGQ